MGLIILCFIVPLIVSIVLAIKERDGEFIFFGLIGGFLFGLIGILIALVGGSCIETDKVYNTETTNLCAFSDFNGVQGSYFLGCGNSNPFATFFLLPFSESTSVYVPEGTIKYNYNIDLE